MPKLRLSFRGELMARFRYDPKSEELVPAPEEEQHDPARARTKFMVMREGRIVFVGTELELETSSDPYLLRFCRH